MRLFVFLMRVKSYKIVLENLPFRVFLILIERISALSAVFGLLVDRIYST